MKRLGCLLWIALWFCFGGSMGFAQEKKEEQKPSEGIEWLKDLDQGMKQAAKDGRPVITYFTYDT